MHQLSYDWLNDPVDNWGLGSEDLQLIEIPINYILCDIHIVEELLPKIKEITPVSKGIVELRLTIAADLLKAFADILKGLSVFFEQAKTKERYIQALTRLKDPEEKAKRKAIYAHNRRLAIQAYTQALQEGLEPREAISEANKRLKAQGHNWSSHYIVTCFIREAGLLRGTNFYKKTKTKEEK